MKAKRLSKDRISNLPSNLTETILCLLPIQEAARTSILSREWRYKCTNISKLIFDEDTFEVSINENQLPVFFQMLELLSQRMTNTKRFKFLYAIFQVLLAHRGPIHEFALSMQADKTCVEIDQIINHLSRYNTLKKFTLHLTHRSEYKLPLSVFSLHHLTELYLHQCDISHQPTFSGFRSLTSLCLEDVNISTKTFLHLLSSCPLLKILNMLLGDDNIIGNDKSTVIELFECLPLIEHMTIWNCIIQYFAQGAVPRKLPNLLVHLKYFCLEDMLFIDKYGLPFLFLVIRSSPNLQKLRIRMLPEKVENFWKYDLDSVTLQDYSDIWLEHLNELEYVIFANLKPELEFVKLILVKSPVLKKLTIVLDTVVTRDAELKLLRTLLRSPPASRVVEIIVVRYGGKHI